MPMQPIPFAPGQIYRPQNENTITQLIARQGDIGAQRAANTGMLWGRALENVGNIAAGAVAQHQQSQAMKKREVAFQSALQSWDAADPQGSMMRLARVTGPEDAMKFGAGLMAFQSMVEKNKKAEIPTLDELKASVVAAHVFNKNASGTFAQSYPTLREQMGPAFKAHLGIDLPPEPNDEVMKGLDALGEEWAPPKKLTTVAPGATVLDEKNQPVYTAPEKKTEPKTVPIEQQLADAAASGDQATYQRLLKVKRDAAMAGRDPNVSAAAQESKDFARLDKSYQFNSAQLETARKPVVDQAERFNRLVATVDERTPQADALVAPELLTVMAGGTGSGLRMNEAEISRIVGGRGNFETLKAKLNKWRLDPSGALTITDAQRSQIKSLLVAAAGRLGSKVEALNTAASKLVDAKSVDEHRRIMADLKGRLTLVETGPAPGTKVGRFTVEVENP